MGLDAPAPSGCRSIAYGWSSQSSWPPLSTGSLSYPDIAMRYRPLSTTNWFVRRDCRLPPDGSSSSDVMPAPAVLKTNSSVSNEAPPTSEALKFAASQTLISYMSASLDVSRSEEHTSELQSHSF